MDINLKQAVKIFFPNPSLELIFIEAVANSIDAEADEISIHIHIQEHSKPETLEISIKDNGLGFTDDRFAKFSKLLEVDEASHKGIGRLVFLSYFNKIDVSSRFENNLRTFQYSNAFEKRKFKLEPVGKTEQETVLSFADYYLTKIGKLDYLRPTYLRKKLLEEFYPKLYLMKQSGKNLTIHISLFTDETDNQELISEKKEINLEEIEILNIEPVDADLLQMFQQMDIHYSIKKKETENTIITALCIDGRTYKMDIVSDQNIPFGYEIIFLLYSSFFNGKVNPSRQELTLDDPTKKIVKKIFQTKVAEILKREIPSIVGNNNKTKDSLIDKYPHLLGYFEKETIGFIKRDESIKRAQEKFFKDQRDVLEASGLSEDIYEKALELSSRALTEYILYRQLTIKKIRNITATNSESDLHNLIVPMGKVLEKSEFMNDLYINNAWLLDDKYMTYKTILSDKIMSEVIKKITEDDAISTDISEPDMALIFSNDPNTSPKVDVVVIELKKKGLKLEDNVIAVTQLHKRATKLMQYYPNRIQRIWFYAIVDFDNELKLYLENTRFTELFSSDIMYYREDEIKVALDAPQKVNIGIYVLSIDAFIEDADSRNSTFLKILKDSFREKLIDQ